MIVKETLPNGLTLVTEEMPGVRSVAVGVWLKRGSRHEADEASGVSHFIEHMVFKGTKTRSAERIAAEVDSIGGYMDAFTAKEYASFHLKVLDEHLPLAVEILGDIVLNPLFDPAEMAKEKKVIFEEINMVEDTPDDLVMELFAEAFWPGHPLGRPILGTKKTVGRFRREDLSSYFSRVYHPGEHPDRRRRPPGARGGGGPRRPPLLGAPPGPPRGTPRARPDGRHPDGRALEEGARAGARLPRAPAPTRRRTPIATPSTCSTPSSAARCPRASSRTCARSAGSCTRSPRASPPTPTRAS